MARSAVGAAAPGAHEVRAKVTVITRAFLGTWRWSGLDIRA
ncbi:hypothetical protein ACFFX0_15810 [Citricoccus parietis]|uniref:Uncharacterized protein n=1 Tax=Citricoccus parietis TaxID=592307 RepID=A0ABV5G0Y5_9MICC